jgi:hypothetical protein
MAKPEVTGKGGIRLVIVVRVVEGVFFREEIASHRLLPRSGIRR